MDGDDIEKITEAYNSSYNTLVRISDYTIDRECYIELKRDEICFGLSFTEKRRIFFNDGSASLYEELSDKYGLNFDKLYTLEEVTELFEKIAQKYNLEEIILI